MVKDTKRRLLSKVPEVSLIFWITKVLTTGMGETTSDFLAHSFSPVIVVACAGILLLASLSLQFYVNRYIPWVYWLSVVMVSVFGTMAADILHVGLGIPYIISTIFFAIILAIVFIVWYRSEKTLSIHSIHTFRREFFYWATVLTTFALGTAAGDLTAVTVGLGYLSSGILFAVVILIPIIAHFTFKLSAIFTFWFAYIITRPLGASFADWMGVSHERGGLNIGTGLVSLVMLLIIAGLVAYLSYTHKDVEHDRSLAN